MNSNSIITRQRHFAGNLQIRSNENGEESRTVEGYAIVFDTDSEILCGNEDFEVRERIAPTAITQELLDGADIVLNYNHDCNRVLGRSVNGQGSMTYTIDERGVKFTVELPDTPTGDEVLKLIRRGDITGCSFAFRTYYFNSDYVTRVENQDQQGHRYITYTVNRINSIHDFSIVTTPAYSATSVEVRGLQEAETARLAPKADTAEVERQQRQMKQDIELTKVQLNNF